MNKHSNSTRVRGFTLIELLSVIAIIGILAGITIPVVSGVRNSAKKAKTRVQFSQWGAGISLFKNTYGYFPRFDTITTLAGKHKVNGALTNTGTTIGDDDYLFRELLSGKGAKWVSPDFVFASNEKVGSANIQNKKRMECVKFDISEITSTTGADAGDSDIKVDGALKDAFGNVEIVVLVDRNGDGLINKLDLDQTAGVTEFPSVRAKGGITAATLKSTKTATEPSIEQKFEDADASKQGVRADVVFYSPGKGGRDGAYISYTDAVWSW
jgi:prepilin-type N-terminal cleavage/methylation domain-containing protein